MRSGHFEPRVEGDPARRAAAVVDAGALGARVCWAVRVGLQWRDAQLDHVRVLGEGEFGRERNGNTRGVQPHSGGAGQHHDDGLGSNVVQHIGHGGRRSVVSQLVLVRQDEVVRCAGHQIRRRVDGLYVGHAARQLRQGHKIVDGARRGLGKDDHAVAVPVLAGVERPDREGQRAGQGILLTRKRVHEVKIGGEPFVCLGVCDHRRLCQDVVLPDGFVLTLHRGEGSTDPRELRCDRHHEPVGGRVLDVECGVKRPMA